MEAQESLALLIQEQGYLGVEMGVLHVSSSFGQIGVCCFPVLPSVVGTTQKDCSEEA